MGEKFRGFSKYLISAALVVVSFYFALKDIDFKTLWLLLYQIDYVWVFVPVPVMIASHWVRAMRWKTMLEPIKKVDSVWNLFSAVMIGYAVNNVIPRGGEFLRPYIFSRREKVSYSSTFATIIVERFIDLIILLLMFGGVSLVFSEQLRTALPNIHIEKIFYPTAGLIVLLILCFYPPFIKFLMRNIVKPVSKKLYDRLNTLFDKFIMGVQIIKKPSQYLRLIIESLMIWFLYTVPMYVMFFSFDFQARLHLGFDDAVILIVISGIGFTVAPTPGAFGVYHLLIQNALVKLYGISMEAALAYATVTHAINYIVQVIPGGLFFFRENIKSIPKKKDIKTLETGNGNIING